MSAPDVEITPDSSGGADLVREGGPASHDHGAFWQPGDPIYHEVTDDEHACPVCGTSWLGDVNVCPTCETSQTSADVDARPADRAASPSAHSEQGQS